MTPEAYALHRERVLYLSEHPLIDGDREDVNLEPGGHHRQTTLGEVML